MPDSWTAIELGIEAPVDGIEYFEAFWRERWRHSRCETGTWI